MGTGVSYLIWTYQLFSNHFLLYAIHFISTVQQTTKRERQITRSLTNTHTKLCKWMYTIKHKNLIFACLLFLCFITIPTHRIINLFHTISHIPFWHISHNYHQITLIILQKGLRRESNPGLPHPKREFYHLTTKPRHVQWLMQSYVMSKRALPGIEPGPPVP